MTLKPLEIRKQQFARTFRGFDPDEVHGFLSTVSREWETLLDEQRRLEGQVEELRSKIEHYQKVEEALQEALQTARENAVRTHKQAEEKAAMIVDQAADKARRIADDADVKATRILDEAERIRRDAQYTASQTVLAAETEKGQVKKEVSRLMDHRNELLSRLRGFLFSEMEILARYEEDDPIGFIKLLPPDRSEQRKPIESTRDISTAASTPFAEPSADSPSETPAFEAPEEIPMEDLAVEMDPLPVETINDSASAEEMDMEFDLEPEPDQEELSDSASAVEDSDERPRQQSGWRIHEVVGKERHRDESRDEPQAEDHGDDSEEMKKIRRILRDLG